MIAGLSIVETRELINGHTLYAVVIQPGKRPSKHHDSLQVYCSCGERTTLGTPDQARAAIILAERNHRLQVGWPEIADWHGTPNGYVNRDCRCDPCTWAWESFRRGDDPWFAAPQWFDDWLETASVDRPLLHLCYR